MPSIDVVIPNYNYGRYLRQCVESVQAQDIEDLRIVIIDNASTDDSLDVARALAAEDPRIEIVAHERNLGQHASYNRAIDIAVSDCMMILCADDVLKPEALRAALDAFEAHPAAVLALGGRSEPWTGETPVGSDPSLDYRVVSGPAFIDHVCRVLSREVPAQGFVVRTSVQRQVGHFRPELPHMDDVEMVLRLADRGEVIVLDGSLFAWRIHPSSQLRQLEDDHLATLCELAAAFDSFFKGTACDRSAALRASTHRRFAEAAYWSGVSHAVRFRWGPARRLFAFAFRTTPSMRWQPPVAYLLQSDRAFSRIRAVLSEALEGALNVHGRVRG